MTSSETWPRQLEHVHRWKPAQWEEFRQLLQEFVEPMMPEDLQAYERSMQEWLEGAEAMAHARRRAGTA